MIKYKIGDLFDNLPDLPENANKIIIIPHIVNNLHAWGSGFVVPLGKKWSITKTHYLKTSQLILGTCQFVKVEEKIYVVNMVAQRGIISTHNSHPLDYKALAECLKEVKENIQHIKEVEIISPAFGSVRSGGSWSMIAKLIDEVWRDFPVTIFSLTQQEQDKILED